MSSSQKTNNKDPKTVRHDETKPGPKQLMLAQATPLIDNSRASCESEMLVELRKLRQENSVSFQDLKTSLNRLESSVREIKQQMEGLDKRVSETENRVSATEDRSRRHERVLGHLLKREANLAAVCDDMENRLRRNNIRLFGVPEGAEENDTVTFITDFLNTSLELQDDVDIKLERAHRALAPKPRDAAAPPRTIIARFLDFRVKQAVLQQAWKQLDVQYQGHKVYFDQDYSSDLQRKRKKVREVIKKLKEKNVKAQSPYPAKLKLFLDTGVKVFSSLLEAQATLKELGIETVIEDRDMLERELMQDGWTTQRGRRRNQQPDPAEIHGEDGEMERMGHERDPTQILV